MRKIVFLNGPKNSGKTAAARFLKDHFIGAFDKFGPTSTMQLSTPLKKAMQELLGLQHSIEHMASKVEGLKDTPNAHFLDRIPRQELISLSEDWLKPRFGDDVLGKIAAKQIPKMVGQLIVIDGVGFSSELIPLVEAVGGPFNCLLIQFMRDGCTFEGDSRSYIETHAITTVQLDNRHDYTFFKDQIIHVVNNWLTR
jgi:hypothetical protein